jgi:exodeoxyribonuclease VII large subunit
MLVLKQEQLQALIDRVVEREKVRLQGFEAVVEARHPQNILRMGFALIRSAGKVVGSTDGLSAGAMVEIEMSDGKLSAEVKSVEKR